MCTGAQEKEEKAECVPGFQEKEYQVEYSGGFLKDVPLLQGTAMMSSAVNERVQVWLGNLCIFGFLLPLAFCLSHTVAV